MNYGNRQSMNRLNKDKNRFSRGLAKLLRHEAIKRGLRLRLDGYAKVADVLSLRENRDFTVNDLIEVVEENDKQRFSLLWQVQDSDEKIVCLEKIKELVSNNSFNNSLYIKANQGHTIEAVESEKLLTPLNLNNLKDYCSFDERSGKYIVVHGTYKKHWESIKKQGLSRLTRNHIHFACGLPNDKQVISGMRSSVELYIYLDIQKALDNGIKFFISDNRVILSEGNNNGFLEPNFFWKVIDRRTNKEISF